MRFRTGVASLLAGAVMYAGSTAGGHAQEFNNFVVFGDSLSDAGTYLLEIDGALTSVRFTVNPYPVWDMLVGAHYGIAITPYMEIDTVNHTSTVLGGTNYAQGGACVNSGYSLTLCPVDASNTLGETQQIATYLAATGGRADPNTLYSTWAGANNIFGEVLLMFNGKPRAEAIAAAGAAAQDQVVNVSTLTQAGARYILVPNLPDIALAPITNTFGEAGFFRDSVNLYNATLNAGLAGLGGSNIIYVDIYSVLNEVYYNPQLYGISNVTTPACTVLLSSSCTTQTLTSPDAQFTNLFADIVHPTPAGHSLLADYIISILQAPGLIGFLADVPVNAGWGIFRTLDGRLDVPETSGWQLYSNVDYSTVDLAGAGPDAGADGDTTAGYVGVEYGFGNGVSAGALLNVSSGSYDFDADLGNFSTDSFVTTLYANLHRGGFYGQVSGAIGNISYDDVTRQFMMGPAQRTNSGSTSGAYYAARLATGYDFTVGGVTAGPVGQLSWQQAEVDAYAETQADASSMRFGRQENTVFFGTVGGRVSYGFELAKAHLTALAQVTYNADLLGDDRSVNAALVSAPVSFDMPVASTSVNWTDIRLGLTVEAGAHAFASLTLGTQVQSGGSIGSYGNVGLTYRF